MVYYMKKDNSPNPPVAMTKKDFILTSLYGGCIISQIILILMYRNTEKNSLLLICGFIFLLLFFLFGGLPYSEFKKMGGAPQGKRYMDTTRLVDTGIYSVVRHPQWLSWIMFSIALVLFVQHWLSALLCVVAVSLIYVQTYDMDTVLIEKFGNAYTQYMDEVPRMNFILGLMRIYRKKNL